VTDVDVDVDVIGAAEHAVGPAPKIP